MRAPGAAAPIAASIVDQAIDWSVKLNFGQADARTRAAFERWRRAAPEHELAWTRVQSLNADFNAVPQGLALDTLTALNGARRRQRRVVLKSLLLAGGVLGTGWAAREQVPWQRLTADVSTGLGERRALTLADGTRLVLNTDSAVSLRLDGAERVVVLHRGEISLDTGSDPGSLARRPFRVRTPYGVVEALGTRFVVRLDDDGARISVQEHAVALTPANLASVAAYRSEVRTYYREMIPFAIIGLIGGAAGALLLIGLGDSGFRPLVPWLLLVATLLFAFSNQIRAFVEPWSRGQHAGARIAAYALMMVVAIYGGFFGAGTGIMMLAALAILESGNFHKANATKILVAFLIQIMSAALLIAGGLVHWPQALVTIAASAVGGYYGVTLARRVPEKIIRAVVVAIGAVLTVVFFVRT